MRRKQQTNHPREFYPEWAELEKNNYIIETIDECGLPEFTLIPKDSEPQLVAFLEKKLEG